GDLEAHQVRRVDQPLGVLIELEDGAAVYPLAFEDAGRIMQGVRENVQVGVAPGHQLAVVPDRPVAVVERWLSGHGRYSREGNFMSKKAARCVTPVPAGCQRAPPPTIVLPLYEKRLKPTFVACMVESRLPANPLFLREEELRQGIELMFYAYRDFTFESDQ